MQALQVCGRKAAYQRLGFRRRTCVEACGLGRDQAAGPEGVKPSSNARDWLAQRACQRRSPEGRPGVAGSLAAGRLDYPHIDHGLVIAARYVGDPGHGVHGEGRAAAIHQPQRRLSAHGFAPVGHWPVDLRDPGLEIPKQHPNRRIVGLRAGVMARLVDQAGMNPMLGADASALGDQAVNTPPCRLIRQAQPIRQ